MIGGWVAAFVLLGFIMCAVAAFAMFSRAVSRQRDREAVSEADLQLLRESVGALIEQIKAASDEAVREIEDGKRELRDLLLQVEAARQPTQTAAAVPAPSLPSPIHKEARPSLTTQDIYRLAGEGVDEAEIAMRSGMTRGEVELMLELQAARR
jgi:hypothetical protein